METATIQNNNQGKRSLRRSAGYGNIVGYVGKQRETSFPDTFTAREWLLETMTAEEAEKQIAKIGNY